MYDYHVLYRQNTVTCVCTLERMHKLRCVIYLMNILQNAKSTTNEWGGFFAAAAASIDCRVFVARAAILFTI